MNELMKPYHREGAWISSISFHYEVAHEFKREYDEALERLQKEEDRLRKQFGSESEADVDGLTWAYTHELRHQVVRAAVAATLFVCMTIEGFVNDYGAKRLGDKYFKRHLERLRITEKLSVLLLTCGIARLEYDDPLIKRIRTIFEFRNQIVHPKTKELADRPQVEDPIPIDQWFETLELLVDSMQRWDPDVRFQLKAMRGDQPGD